MYLGQTTFLSLFLVLARVVEEQTPAQDSVAARQAQIEQLRARQRAAQQQSGAISCEGLHLPGAAATDLTYTVYALPGSNNGKLKVEASDFSLNAIVLASNGQATFWAGVGAHDKIVAVANECLRQQSTTPAAGPSPTPVAPVAAADVSPSPVPAPAPSGRRVLSADPASHTVTVNDVGVSSEVPVPVKIIVEMLSPKGSDAPVPAGFRFEWDETHGHGDNAIHIHRVLTYDGHYDEQKGIDVGKGMKGLGTALARRGASTRAGNSTDMSMNRDKTFKEVASGGSNETTHYGGHDQSEYATYTGKTDPAVAAGKRRINSVRLDLEAAIAASTAGTLAMPEFTAALQGRGERELQRMREITGASQGQ